MRSRAARRLRGHLRTRSKSPKRDEPYQTPRRIRIVHFSTTISRVRPIEQFDVSRSRRASAPMSSRAEVHPFMGRSYLSLSAISVVLGHDRDDDLARLGAPLLDVRHRLQCPIEREGAV